MQVFNKISFNNLRGDLFGGVTAAIVSLPLALAFGVASGIGPVAGLYGAVCIGLFAALFGGTPTLISEPTGPMTVVMTTIVASLIAKNPENGLAMAFTVVMLAGLFQIVFGIFKLGKYITLMPYSVISGFMSGIGVILIILQIPPFLGQTTPKGGVLGTLQSLPQLLTNINAGQGRVLLFYLSGPMIFGVAKAIAREESVVQNYDVLIFDLSDVPMLGVTASLAIENAIKDAVDKGRQVFILTVFNP